ncbi:MAG: M1 family metallopeptidase [Bacteroidia bacterium]
MQKFLLLVGLSLLMYIMPSCGTPEEAPESKKPVAETAVQDPHSYAIPAEAVVSHLDLNIELDFESKKIKGEATLSIERNKDSKSIHLDTKELNIISVKRSDSQTEREDAPFQLSTEDHILGQELTIELGPKTNMVHIQYETSPEAEALQWLDASLTAGKKMPFLLTQSQAINARTWVPTQDGPGIRFTYNATVKAPEGMMVLMSAENPTTVAADGMYHFKMTQPIPAYLLALAAGDISYKALGDRSGVYADPGMLAKSAYEFEELESMITLAEGLYGPYRWDRYDLIVLPPSFPFGGMENPRLTFATPTILAGDRSLVSLVAHELAHSWSGNLVTNATWDDFWLNEGFTVYFEMRIMEALKGRDYSEMLATLSYQDLLKEVRAMGPESRETWLKADLKGQNPDDGVTSIAYDKGYYFLRLLEETVGREKFDAFLKSYFDKHAFQTMTTEAFVKELKSDLLKGDEKLAESIGIQRWIYGPGVPKNCPKASPARFVKVDEGLAAFEKGQDAKLVKANDWSSHEWLHFIRNLPTTTGAKGMKALDKQFGLTKSGNAEIQCAWYTQALNNQYEAAYPAIEQFLIAVGRRKFLTPLYDQMVQNEKKYPGSEGGMKLANRIYDQARAGYHPISYNTIDKLLGR